MQYKLFGCKVNKYYLNQWSQYFIKKWINEIDSVILASCEVTDRAKKKWIKEITRYVLLNKKVYLTWCGSIQRWKVVDENVFYDRYPELVGFASQIVLLPETPVDYSVVMEDDLWLEDELVLRKPIIIQTGCDNFCSFCLTVRKRWPHKSRMAKNIIKEIQDFEKKWWKEIVLTWINLAARGCEDSRNPDDSKFSELLKIILKETSIERIRISSLGPEYLDDDFFEVIGNTRFLPHFHFSVQSFSDNVLSRMKRNYDSRLLDEKLTKIKKIYKINNSDINYNDKISIGADVILGFPGETEEDFMKTYNSIWKYGITKLHAFPFSDHQKWETIPASLFDKQVDLAIKKERVKKIIKYWDEIRNDFILKQKWNNVLVLMEQQKLWKWQGWTENHILVQKEWKFKRGDIFEMRL